MVGKTLGHYEILESLGAGGMGEVYRAQDTKLDRDVAIKVLPEGLVDDPDRLARFEGEAKLLASLNHPNVATVYGLEHGGGVRFIAMELVEGETLQARLQRGPLSLDNALDIASGVAGALAAAHQAGIVHRDLKPANVMLTEDGNRVKLLDFGIAAPLPTGNETGLTDIATALGPVAIAGTVPYMSPEQVRGQEVSRGTDVWAFGCLVFEMLVGRPAFMLETAADTLSAILEREPSWDALPSDTPPAVRTILESTLEKSAERRPRDIRDLSLQIDQLRAGGRTAADVGPPAAKPAGRSRAALLVVAAALLIAVGWLASGVWITDPAPIDELPPTSAASAPGTAIAVLPFANLRADPETDFLGYALADEIISKLSLVEGMTVRPSSAVRRYQGQSLDAATISTELQVAVLLTGSYLQDGDSLRLNIELVDVEANESTWRDSIQVDYEDVFTVQDLVTEKVATGLLREFSAATTLPPAHTPSNPTAYNYYLRSLGLPSTNEGATEAIALLEQSIDLDPDYAPARHQLGFRHYMLANFGSAGDQALRRAESEYRAALALDPEYLPALSDLSAQLVDVGELDEAVRLAREAVALNPANAYSRFALAYAYRYAGLLEESAHEWDTVLALDPVNRRWRSAVMTYVCVGDYEKALDSLDQDADSQYARAWQGDIMVALERPDEARRFFALAREVEAEGLLADWTAAHEAALRGDRASGSASLRGMADAPDSEVHFNTARVYCLLGDREACIGELQEAVDRGYANFRCARDHPNFAAVNGTPEYRDLLAVMEQRHDELRRLLFADR